MNTEEERPDLNEEEPQISIVWDDDELPPQPSASQPTAPKQRNWGWKVCAVLLSLIVVCGVAWGAWRLCQYYYYFDLPVSVTPGENVAKLEKEASKSRNLWDVIAQDSILGERLNIYRRKLQESAPTDSDKIRYCTDYIANLERGREILKSQNPGVVMTQDSIHGVALNLYRLRGLQATLSVREPAPTDSDVILYCRSADYAVIDHRNIDALCDEHYYLGDLVIDGKKKWSKDGGRLGYCGMANGNVVIGVSRSDKVMDYCIEHGGSFFRQFVLLSDGEMPRKFYLHGRVERCALARLDNDQLYFITTRHKELLLDFADALRAYGFTDAIYITGGSSYSFYRDREGNLNYIGDPNEHPSPEHMTFVPWLVFRAS